MALKKITKEFRLKDGQIHFSILEKDIPELEPCIFTIYVNSSLMQEKRIILKEKYPKHRKFIEVFISKYGIQPVTDIMHIDYLFFFSIMPYLFFFESVRNLLTFNVIYTKRYKKQIIFFQPFISGLAGVIHGS